MLTKNSLNPIETVTRLNALDKIVINDVEYQWHSDEGDNRYFSRLDGDGRTISYNVRETEEMIERGKIVVFEDYYTRKSLKRRNVSGHESLFAMKDAKIQEALRKQRWVELAMRAKEEGKYKDKGEDFPDVLLRDYKKMIAQAMARANKRLQTTQVNSKTKAKGEVKSEDGNYLLGETPPLRTLNHWISKYVAADFDISGLIDKRTGDTTPRFTVEERNLHARFALKFGSRNKPSVRHLHRRMMATFNYLNRARVAQGKEKLRPLGATSFRTMIDKLPDFYKMAGRLGKRRARLHFLSGKGGADKYLPLQRVESDEWTVELKTIFEDTAVWAELTPEERRALGTVRLFFSGVIDLATKCILAFRVFVEAPNLDSARTTLELTTRDKTFLAKAAGCKFPWEMKGKFRTIGLDNASWNKSNALRGTLLDAGVTEVFPPAKEPYLRGTIERFFRTIAFLGLQDFSGRTFSNVVMKGDYDDERVPTIRNDQLAKIFIRLIVDVYHNTPHSSLWGATPRQAWLEMTRGKKVPPAPTGFHRRAIYGTPLVRAITKEGIVFEDIQFQSEEIQKIRQHDEHVLVHIRVDRFDLSEISVLWKDGFLRVPATLKGLERVTYWQWMKAKERLRVADKANLELVADAVADAVEWAAQEAEVADAALELTSPVLKFEEYVYEAEKATRYIKVVDKTGMLSDKVRDQAALIPEIANIFGRAAVTAAITDTEASKRAAAEIASRRDAAAKASSIDSSDDEFGIID